MTATPADTANPELILAKDFVQHTCNHVFLTGKAGTGKTTFLHNLKHSITKRMIVTAPTGVAAINAGGVTLHSFFQMPFGPYVPGSDAARQAEQRRFSQEKINIIKGLDLLVIDEISMVRADLLDGVDAVLRRYKYPHLPFGGVQLLMIGDLHQLAPVVKDDEWHILKRNYDSCYFFSSNALQQTELKSIELKHIYRQSDAEFIRLLNQVRDNRLDDHTLQLLNTRYRPSFQPEDGDDYITLTTHNRSADQRNDQQLDALRSEAFSFEASITGDYPKYSYPTAEKLLLKKGAQVMFVRNDSSTGKNYFNGKIGKITHIDKQGITVKCPGDPDEVIVEPARWENIKYTVDKKNGNITEDVIGTFSQYPLRPAWAITIHKSQGLTFERAIIDANAAFSHGQVYVALSRCKTFEGMVLSTRISRSAVKTDTAVAKFVDKISCQPPTQEQLQCGKIAYQQQLLLDMFDFVALASAVRKHFNYLLDNRHLIQFSGMDTLTETQVAFIDEVITVSDKFKRQLQSLFNTDYTPEADMIIQERVQKACCYFDDKLQAGLHAWLSSFRFGTDNQQMAKQLNAGTAVLQYGLAIKTACLQHCRAGFSTTGYLKALAHAEMEFSARPPAKKQVTAAAASASAPAGVPSVAPQHPGLFQALQDWRVHQAKAEAVEHYRILHQRVLLEIASMMPMTAKALLSVKGIGKTTADKYGPQIIAIVSEYCRTHAIAPRQASPLSTDTLSTSISSTMQGET